MAILESRIDTNGRTFAENRAENLARIDEVRALEARVRANSARQADDRVDRRLGLLPNVRCSAAGATRTRAAAPSTNQHWGVAATCQTGTPGARPTASTC